MLLHFKKSNEILETWSPHCKNLAFKDPSSLNFHNRTDAIVHRYMVHWLFQPFTIFATFCRVGMKLTCYFHSLPKEMFLCGFVSYEDVKVIKCWLWHNIKVCIGKKIAQSFPLVYFMESNNNLATG